MTRPAVRITMCAVILASLFPAAGCAARVDGADGRFVPGLDAAEPRRAGVATGTVPAALMKRAPLVPAIDPDERFDTSRALAEAEKVASFGVRAAGSAAEKDAALYIERRLRNLGYEPVVETFALPNGKTSRNVIASVDGYASKRTVILGAHIDSKPPSPGANDNGTGVGVVLELARLLRHNPAAGRVEFVFYGSEEIIDAAKPDGHHFGSRHHAEGLTAAERRNTAGMMSVDMVGVGTSFQVQTMRRGPQSLSDLLLSEARERNVALRFKQDLGRTGWSDHEPYELAGIPAVWIHWQDDPDYHTPGDTADHLQRRPMDTTGRFLLAVLRDLDPGALSKLCDR